MSDKGLPVTDPKFWHTRLIDALSKGKELHTVIYNIDYKQWQEIQARLRVIVGMYLSAKDSILDVGCGYGALYDTLEDRRINYLGIDIAPDLIDIAHVRHPEYKDKFQVLDICNNQFRDEQFDLAICVSVRKMILDNMGEEYWNKMLKEMKRVAKRVLVIEYEGKVTYRLITNKTELESKE